MFKDQVCENPRKLQERARKGLDRWRKSAVQQMLDCLWRLPADVNGWLGAPRPSGGFTCSGPRSRQLRLPHTWLLGEDGYSSLTKLN